MLSRLIRANDELVAELLPQQQCKPGHPAFGSVADKHGIATAHDTVRFIATLGCAYRAPGSIHHQSPALVEPLQDAARYLLTAQHDDGTIDLVATNFHSPPDTAFVLDTVATLAAVLRDQPSGPLDRLRDDLATFIRRAAYALVTGGVHTPNHRWAVCAGLARAYSLYPDLQYISRMDQWLAETIDLDPDGQYTEKSTTVYSPVVNRALLTVARLLNRPELCEPVRRNLEMTLYYVHPDGEVVTEASKRQDKYQRGSMANYYYSYRYLALRDGNGRFAAMARQIERTAASQLVRELPSFFEEPELLRTLPPDEPLPVDYARVFPHSHLARIRRDAVSATILAQNATLFSLRRGSAALEAVRLASAFFGKGQFIGGELGAGRNSYLLEQTLEGVYYQPLSPVQLARHEPVRLASNGTLANEGSAKRALSERQTLASRVDITESARGFVLTFAVDGTDNVPVAVELSFRHGGTLGGVEPVAGVPHTFLLREGTGHYTFGADTIEFGPGRADHTWTQLRGASPKWDGLSVYLTGLTPFYITLNIA